MVKIMYSEDYVYWSICMVEIMYGGDMYGVIMCGVIMHGEDYL